MIAPSPQKPHDLARRLSGQILIDGKLCAPAKGQTFGVLNPATGEIIAQAAQATAEDVHRAAVSAKKAQIAWAQQDALKRGHLLMQCADLLETHSEELAHLLTLETGKALATESRGECTAFTHTFRYYGGLALELKGETLPFSEGMLTLTLHEPIGVVGAIIPWNVPLLLMSFKVAPALAAGNAVVLKSAEEAPLAVLRVAELLNTLLPPGLFNVLSGDGPTCGAPLVSHPLVTKLTFTGSVETGKSVYRQASEKLIPVTLELGGKSPMIVCDDVDLEQAISGAVTSMRFTRQGQSCTAASRILVHTSHYEAFVKGLQERLNTLHMGDPFEEKTDIGAIISPAQYEKISSYIQLGKSAPEGKAHISCQLPQAPHLQKGLYIQPHIFTGLPNTHRLCQEEIFGPVTCVIPWKSFDDALHMANETSYGLAASIWTKNITQALQAVKKLEAGFVQVNQNLVVQAGLSFGGYKHSGLGKEASFEAMLEHYTRKKTVMMSL